MKKKVKGKGARRPWRRAGPQDGDNFSIGPLDGATDEERTVAVGASALLRTGKFGRLRLKWSR